MFFTAFKRITRTGFISFWRNGFLSFSAIVVMTLSLCAFGALVFSSVFGHTLLAQVKDKVDINVYFTLSAQEPDILAVQKDLEALPEVATVEYVSSAQALSDFQAKWKDNTLIMQGLQELGDNPFPAALNIKAKDPGQYANIASYLTDKNPTDASGTPIIDKVNYAENKLVIDRLSTIIPLVEDTGIVVAAVLILIAMAMVFNTIRLIIYTSRDEISVMKLVGASNAYARGPFVVSGIMYGIISGIITLVLMAAVVFWSDALIIRFLGINAAANLELVSTMLSSYFIANFGEIFSLIMGSGIVLGGISSYVAARRYLKV